MAREALVFGPFTEDVVTGSKDVLVLNGLAKGFSLNRATSEEHAAPNAAIITVARSRALVLLPVCTITANPREILKVDTHG
jgi:hypothetical protein